MSTMMHIIAEDKWLNTRRYRLKRRQHTHAEILPFLPYRYRDNIVGLYFKRNGCGVDHPKKLFQDIYGLTLQRVNLRPPWNTEYL